MTFYNLVRTALYSIRAYKLRIFLTMIGIIIGISSVSAILAIGEGLKAQASSSIEEANLNKITISYTPSSSSTGNEEPFKEEQISQIENIRGVKTVETNDDSNPFFNFNVLEAKYFDKSVSIDIKNYDDDYPKLKVIAGRDMGKEERASSENIVMITKQDAENLFDDIEQAVGKGISIDGDIYEVIGITEGLDTEMGFGFGPPPEFDLMAAVVPEGIELSEQDESDEITNISVGIGPEREKDKILEDVEQKLHELNPELDGEYTSFDMQDILEEMQGIINNITKFVAFVTGISLLVGGIGVMNIMYVSVTERKREIGIRRAIGAKPRSILMQFLMEAIFITGFGGLIGIASGYLLSLLIGSFLPFEPVMTVSNFIGASSISVMTGLVFGIIPASKAAKLDPIVAIYK